MLAVLLRLVIMMCLLGAMSPCPVYAASDTGWKDPTANVADAGDGFEGSPENAYSDDTAIASNMDGAGDSHIYYGYDFGLPGGATIEGIEVRLDWYVDGVQGNTRLQVELSWDGGISWTPAQKTKKGKTTETTEILGSPGDTWGHNWTVDELSDANFRVRITCTSSKPERDFYLDWVAVNIYDDPPTVVHLSSFTARSGRSAAGREVWHFWPWVCLVGLAALGAGRALLLKRRSTTP